VPYCANCGTQELKDQSFCSACGAPTALAPGEERALPYFPMDEPVAPVEVELAGFWWRVLGYLIDSIIVGLVVTLPLRVGNVDVGLSSLLKVAAAFIYGFLFMAYGNGRTLGMRMVGTRCVNAANRAPLTVPQAFRRALAYSALVLVGSIYHAHQNTTGTVSTIDTDEVLVVYLLNIPHFLDLLWVAWDEKKQSLHDKFAGTIVLRPAKS
jgi:uncharacterized RDD family membrane protein YckC